MKWCHFCLSFCYPNWTEIWVWCSVRSLWVDCAATSRCKLVQVLQCLGFRHCALTDDQGCLPVWSSMLQKALLLMENTLVIKFTYKIHIYVLNPNRKYIIYAIATHKLIYPATNIFIYYFGRLLSSWRILSMCLVFSA